MSNFPFTQERLDENTLLREFKNDVEDEELVWHRDRENRQVRVIRGEGWQLQIENRLPVKLLEGQVYKIPKNTYHRLLKGQSNLVVIIREEAKMKIKNTQLRSIIREALMLESASDQVRALLDRDYEKSFEDTRYPYGRNRGDVRRTERYVRKDGQPVPPEDFELLKARDAEVRKAGGSMAALSGVYTTKLSDDGLTLDVQYYRHTAG